MFRAEEAALVSEKAKPPEEDVFTVTVGLLCKIFDVPKDPMTERVKFRVATGRREGCQNFFDKPEGKEPKL